MIKDYDPFTRPLCILGRNGDDFRGERGERIEGCDGAQRVWQEDSVCKATK